MHRKQHNGVSGAFEELADLLLQLRFTHETADRREGKHWTVYAHPWVGEEDGYFDALIAVTPRSVAADTGAGMRVVVQHENITWLSTGSMNPHGQIWFKELPCGHFSARLVGIEEREEEAVLAAARFDTQLQEAPYAGPHIYYLSDRRVIALLEQGTDGRAVLTVETEASELAGVMVRFSLGRETGEVALAPTGAPGVWRGSARLHHAFDVAETYVPDFAIMPPSRQE